MEHFTPISSVLGGALIGLSAFMLMWLNGRVAGISGIVGGLTMPASGDTGWRVMFVVGLVAGGIALVPLMPAEAFGAPSTGLMGLLAAGLLVGFGARLGSGCTSGHGVCGLSRGSLRSLAGVMTFMTTGAVTVFVVRWLSGGAS